MYGTGAGADCGALGSAALSGSSAMMLRIEAQNLLHRRLVRPLRAVNRFGIRGRWDWDWSSFVPTALLQSKERCPMRRPRGRTKADAVVGSSGASMHFDRR